jgi:hypothetical protein
MILSLVSYYPAKRKKIKPGFLFDFFYRYFMRRDVEEKSVVSTL